MSGRVMVVDDSKIITKVVSGLLSGAGYQVEAVNSPFGVASKLWEFRPNLVLMDLNIPGLNGSKIIEIMTAREYDFEFGIVVYSSEEEALLKRASCLKGVCGYIRKGVSNEDLVSAVGRYISEFVKPPAESPSDDTVRSAGT